MDLSGKKVFCRDRGQSPIPCLRADVFRIIGLPRHGIMVQKNLMKFSLSPLNRNFLLCSVMAMAVSLTAGCQAPKKSSIEDARYYPPQPQAKQVATVAYLNEPAGFVLLEVSPGFDATPGNELVTLQGGKVQSTLKIAEHRRPPYVVADVTDKMPPVGARVFELP